MRQELFVSGGDHRARNKTEYRRDDQGPFSHVVVLALVRGCIFDPAQRNFIFVRRR